MADAHKNAQEQFINLLLKYKDVVNFWVTGNLSFEHFDEEYHTILRAIHSAYDDGFLLTRKGYREYLEAGYGGRTEKIAQEHLYNRIYAIKSNKDDLDALIKKLLKIYLSRSSNKILKKFQNSAETRGIEYAVKSLKEDVDGLTAYADVKTTIEYNDVSSFVDQYFKYAEDLRSGKIKEDEEDIKCGIPEIDYTMVSGFSPGTLTLFCADVGGFKSTMMLNIALNVWESGKNVAFVPLEMPKKQIISKIFSRESKIPYETVDHPLSWNDDDRKTLYETKKRLFEDRKSKLWLLETEDRTKVSVIRREIEKNIESFKPKIVIVDYIANLVPDKRRGDRNDLEIGDMLKDLRHMGKNLKFAVVSGAQIGREALKRLRKSEADDIAVFSEDIRGSHEYSADADNIYAQIPDETQPDRLLDIYVVKARVGKKIFQNGKKKATLQVEPEISLITSRNTDWGDPTQEQEALTEYNNIINHIEDTLEFDNDEEPKKEMTDNDLDELI